MPADVIVASEAYVAEWGEVEGTMLHAALSEGRVVAEAWRPGSSAAAREEGRG